MPGTWSIGVHSLSYDYGRRSAVGAEGVGSVGSWCPIEGGCLVEKGSKLEARVGVWARLCIAA